MGKRHCLDMGMKIRLLPQPAGLSVLGSAGPAGLRALMVLTWGPLYLYLTCRRGQKVERVRAAAPWGCCWSTHLRSVSPATS